MKERIVKFLVGFLVASERFWIMIFEFLNKHLDFKFYTYTPNFLKALKEFLKDIGLGESKIVKILKVMKHAYVEADGDTDPEVLEKLEEEVKN